MALKINVMRPVLLGVLGSTLLAILKEFSFVERDDLASVVRPQTPEGADRKGG
jgi:hypothetical protein